MNIYLYHKRHRKTGLNYFGKTKGHNPIGYLGSGVYWRAHLNKHGEDVETVQLWEFNNIEDCNEFAINFSIKNNIVESKEWANLCIEDGIGGGDVLSQLSAERYSEICENRSKKVTKVWETRSREMQAEKQTAIWNSRPEEIKKNIYDKISDTIKNKSPEEKEESLRKRKETLSNRTEESIQLEKQRRKAYLDSRPSLTCSHCGLISKSAVNMRRYHFDNCKKK